jgi:chemotaxis protein methyltransferase CheR
VQSFDDRRPALSEEEFHLLRDIVYEHCGIRVRDEMKFVMERRLWPRLDVLAMRDFSAYYRYLHYDLAGRAELEAAVDALTTNETYFFREPLQLRAFSEELLPRLKERNAARKRLRIWSAGCSSGEEPYTIAMLIHATGEFTGWDVGVYGTDISRRVLSLARRGEYGPSSFRVAPPAMVQRYLQAAGPRMRVTDEIRAWVSFGHLNLLDRDLAPLVPPADLILCRNVMIYFDEPARRRVLDVFYDKLNEGGFLLLGHSESLLSVSTAFELVHLQHDLAYRRPPRSTPGMKPGRGG